MSELPRDYRDQINLREQITRIDRNQAEIQKLFAERDKLNRDHWLLVLAALITAFAVVVARLP